MHSSSGIAVLAMVMAIAMGIYVNAGLGCQLPLLKQDLSEDIT